MKKVLIISKDLRNQGGVVDFVSMILKYKTNKYQYFHFPIGNAPNIKKGVFRANVISDTFRLCIKAQVDKWDCIHINPSFVWKSLIRDIIIIRLITLFNRNRVFVFIHGWDADVAGKISTNYFLKKIICSTFNKCSLVMVLASVFKEDLVSLGVDTRKIHVTTTMFDGKYLKKVSNIKNDKSKVILFLSRFVKEKGIYELLDAFKLLNSESSKYKLILAGDGPERIGMEKYVEENKLQNNVEFCGFVRDLNKAEVLVSADVFVFPSYYGEGCPVSLLEAMAAGLPIVTSAAGGIEDFFIGGENGVLLKEITAGSIKTAIESLLSNDVLLVKIGAHNAKIAWREYEASVMTTYIEDMYEKVIDQV